MHRVGSLKRVTDAGARKLGARTICCSEHLCDLSICDANFVQRCDGIRPCCTQCSNVGFECKTSDKLSRRAFPRGYTESLEDRVRGLEAEVRELKDLLDEKDEKIDMLSRIHSFSPHSRKCSESLSPAASDHLKSDLRSTSQEFLQIETPAPVGPSVSSPNPSSTAAFIGL